MGNDVADYQGWSSGVAQVQVRKICDQPGRPEVVAKEIRVGEDEVQIIPF